MDTLRRLPTLALPVMSGLVVAVSAAPSTTMRSALVQVVAPAVLVAVTSQAMPLSRCCPMRRRVDCFSPGIATPSRSQA